MNPFIDGEGLLCVGGRAGEHPLIMPKEPAVMSALVWYYRNKSHVGLEWILSLLSEDFWLVGARPLVRRLISRCVTCGRMYARNLWPLVIVIEVCLGRVDLARSARVRARATELDRPVAEQTETSYVDVICESLRFRLYIVFECLQYFVNYLAFCFLYCSGRDSLFSEGECYLQR